MKDKSGSVRRGLACVRFVFETEYRRIFSANNLSHHEGHLYSGIPDRLGDSVAEAGFVVAFDQQRTLFRLRHSQRVQFVVASLPIDYFSGQSMMERNDDLERLRGYLAGLPGGQISHPSELILLLAACWHQFDGSNMEAMAAHKLQRLNDIRWNRPILEFTIERHGGTVMGSTRASLQRWHVDLDNLTAGCGTSGYRQLHKRQSPLDVRPIAKDLASKIVGGIADARLRWQSPLVVRIDIGKVIPGTGFKQTVQGRRKRFRAEIEPLLREHGWESLSSNRYSKSNEQSK